MEDFKYRITEPGQELTPEELGRFHAWVMEVQRKIDLAYIAIEFGIEPKPVTEEDVTALGDIQYELDDVAWLIDEESWEASREKEVS